MIPTATVSRLRWASGLVLTAYLICHLANHAFGLISIEAMTAAQSVFLLPWRPLPMTVLLTGAFLLHAALAAQAVLRRRNLRMAWWERVQLALGFALPALLGGHVAGTLAARLMLDVEPGYPSMLLTQWVFAPKYAWLHAAAVVAAWGHACIGLHHRLKFRSGYRPMLPALAICAAVLPTLALAGFLSAGQDIRAFAESPLAVGSILAEAAITDAVAAEMARMVMRAELGALGFVAAVFAGHGAIRLAGRLRRTTLPVLSLPDGRRLRILPGASVLETLRAAGIPHPSVCGGRARCTTCRVRVLDGDVPPPPPDAEEAAALARIHAPPGLRLACRVRPAADLAIVPLVAGDAAAAARDRRGGLEGREMRVTCVFLDLRGSTALAETKLPYDVLFVLNHFFAEMAAAVEETGGHYAQFNGDGLMALYGLSDASGPDRGARESLHGAAAMLERLARLNAMLADELPAPLRMGIGIHQGDAIVGAMGPPAARTVTAIGDSINTAARLEALSKTHDVPLVVSEAVIAAAGVDPGIGTVAETTLRGRSATIRYHVFEHAPRVPDGTPAPARSD